MKIFINTILFFLLTLSISAQKEIKFYTNSDKPKIEFGQRTSGNVFYAEFGKTTKDELKSVNKDYEFHDYGNSARLGVGLFYFDDNSKLTRFEYQSELNENTQFYLNDVLLIDRNRIMKIYDDLIDLGFEYYGLPKIEKDEIDLKSFYSISNGKLQLYLYPFGRVQNPLSRKTPYIEIEKVKTRTEDFPHQHFRRKL